MDGLMVIGLVSTFQEGELAYEAVATTAEACDTVIVFDGPVGDANAAAAVKSGTPTNIARIRRGRRGAVVVCGAWASDAAKRQAMVEYARRFTEPARAVRMSGSATPDVWLVFVDGDEVLLWARFLPDILRRVEPDKFNVLLKLAELDGSVVKSSGRCLRLSHIARYHVAAYQVELANGVLVALPNVPSEVAPLQGEPHILHRSALRSQERAPVTRLHDDEARWFPGALRDAGLGNVG